MFCRWPMVGIQGDGEVPVSELVRVIWIWNSFVQLTANKAMLSDLHLFCTWTTYHLTKIVLCCDWDICSNSKKWNWMSLSRCACTMLLCHHWPAARRHHYSCVPFSVILHLDVTSVSAAYYGGHNCQRHIKCDSLFSLCPPIYLQIILYNSVYRDHAVTESRMCIY